MAQQRRHHHHQSFRAVGVHAKRSSRGSRNPGGYLSAAVLSLALLLASSAFGKVINRCWAVIMGFISKGFKFCKTHQYSVTACYPVCNRERVPRESVTQSPPAQFVVLPRV